MKRLPDFVFGYVSHAWLNRRQILTLAYTVNLCNIMCLVGGFPGSTVVKNLLANARDVCSTPGLGWSPGGGNGNPLQYSFLGNPMGRGAWWATGHGVTKAVYDLGTKQQHNVTNSTSYIGLACRDNFWHTRGVKTVHLVPSFLLLSRSLWSTAASLFISGSTVMLPPDGNSLFFVESLHSAELVWVVP